jgi:hypothetical protein
VGGVHRIHTLGSPRKKYRRKPPVRTSFGHWTKLLGVSTVLLVVATGYSAYVLNVTDHTLRETLEASSRAWAVPHHIQLLEPIEANKETKLALIFGNVGHEPALNTGEFNETKLVTVRADGSPAKPADFGRWIDAAGFSDTCAKAMSDTNGPKL